MKTSIPKSARPRPRRRPKVESAALRDRRNRTSRAKRAKLASRPTRRYSRIEAIDGRHPLQGLAPGAVVPYPVRRRRDSEIAFFNFELAREMGLIPASHPDEMNPALRRVLLDTFSLVIVNEWDQAHGRRPEPRDRRAHPYMATRYLQLQHPDKRGLNSGDGRSIWNGLVHGRGGSWDVSSCGTGVTRLCPATSALGRFFKTGNAITDYGCGTAQLEEGIGAALMSEAFARNGIRTERVLLVLSLPSGQAINVRVAPNLLRPSHLFGLLRRRRDEDLRQCVLYYAEREMRDGRWPRMTSERAQIRYLAERVAIDFARVTARFESEYIFCWLDWDGDNILCDGSIVDYGSVRQFGLYHHSYRFSDSDRMSTSIPEQKRKARQIVQRFAQIRDLLLDEKPPALSTLSEDSVLEIFDREFEHHERRLFLQRLGFEDSDVSRIGKAVPACLATLQKLHKRLERRRSSRGRHRVADGLSWNAVYCMRDVLRELPRKLIERAGDGSRLIPPEAFFEIALSDYASRIDRQLTPYRRRLAGNYQRAFLELCQWVAQRRKHTLEQVLGDLAPRAAARNPYARMTGDGLTHATQRLTVNRGRLAPEETYRLIMAFAISQQHDASDSERRAAEDAMDLERPLVRRIHRDLQRLTSDYRESI